MARRFPGSRLAFDAAGGPGRRLMRETFEGFGMENCDGRLVAEGVSELRGWAPGADVSSKGHMPGCFETGDPNVTGLHRFLARRCDNMVKMRASRFDF